MARFASQLGFKVHFNTMHIMRLLKDELYTLSPERVFEEFRKAIVSKDPVRFFDILNKVNVLDVHFPKIERLLDTPQVKKWHPEGNVYIHTMMALDVISQLTDLEHVRFAVLCHDLGKGLTNPDNWPHHYKHDHIGIDALNSLAERIPLPNKWYDSAAWTIKQHQRITKWKIMKPGKVVRLFEQIKRSPLDIKDVFNIVLADKYGRGYQSKTDTMNGIELLYYKMFTEVTGNLIDSERYQGKEFGEQLFQKRCHWIKANR
ncbi:MAG: HD domain-containing protein [Halanaerobiales bacterium]